jgi:intracellular multiplication protein IcmK
VFRLAAGNAGSLTFSDSTGQPWAVETATSGAPDSFKVDKAGRDGQDTNIVIVSPMTGYGHGNLLVKLQGHPVPVALTLKAGEKEVDYRLDVRVIARGPKAAPEPATVSGMPSGDDRDLRAFLDNTPPQRARRLKTTAPAVEAWQMDDMVYVRSSWELMSPAYLAKAAGINVKVYALGENPVLMFSNGGTLVTVSLDR